MKRAPTALIADDEPLLRDALARLLAQAWPELQVVALARNGREAVEHCEAQQPDICFLDVHMPGLSGVEAARYIDRRAQLVFVTAFDRFAISKVPSFVLVRDGTRPVACASGSCAPADSFLRSTGDVSLDYALEYMQRSAPAFAPAAELFLKRIKG